MNRRDHHESLETFYKYQKWIFNFYGLWKLPDTVTPRYRLHHTIYFYFVLIVLVLSFDICCVTQVILKISDLNETIKVVFMFATCMAMFSKFSNMKLNNHLYQELIETLQRPMFRPSNQREIQLFRKSQSLSRYMRNFFYILSILSLQAILVPQYFIDNTELPLSIYNPVNVDKRWRYIIMYLYQYATVSTVCYVNIAYDTLSCSFLIHIKGQLDIICDRLEYLGTEHNHLVNDKEISIKLKNCIKFYDEIEQFTRKVEGLVSSPISAQIICSVIVLMANFYAISFLSDPGDYVNFLKFVLYQSSMLSQIFILCYFSSEVTSKSEEISYYLYCSRWVEWNKFNRKLALLMMYRFSLPIHIRSFIPTYTFNLAAFTSIVNTSYSYFTLLKRFNS